MHSGSCMLTLRSAIELTQAGLAQALGVSRRSVADWEAGNKHPKAAHLKQFIALAVTHQAFQAGHEADDIRALWKAAHQKELLERGVAVRPAVRMRRSHAQGSKSRELLPQTVLLLLRCAPSRS